MGKISDDLDLLSMGIKPDSMDYSLESYIEKNTLSNEITYKTVNEEFYINVFDPILISMYPQLMTLVLEEYENNKHRTPLQEMEELQKNKSPFILNKNDDPDKRDK
jgi:hypothetical protein